VRRHRGDHREIAGAHAAALIADHSAPFQAFLADAARALAAGRPRRKPLTAAIRHALEFQTWRSLARDGGLGRAQAVRLMAALVEGAGGPRTRAAAAGPAAAA
jgi:hypothetical protein